MRHDDEESWHRFINYYYNCLRDVDRRLGQLLWALKESGQIDNTIIIYTSDHGERAGAHGMRQKGATMYREEANIPMIVAPPAFPGGRTPKGRSEPRGGGKECVRQCRSRRSAFNYKKKKPT